MKRYLMTFSYDGTNYQGYQKQVKHKTIQGEIETALKKLNSNKKVTLVASGRTDAGVHALNQKAHFDLDKNQAVDKLRHSLNSLLPNDIYIKSIQLVSHDFHARYDAQAKEYIYKINLGEYNPLERNYIYQYNKPLEIEAIVKALTYLEGEHDFKSFAGADNEKENYVRTIIKTNLVKDPNDVNKISIYFLGTGFLKHMIRNIVGTLMEIGVGKRKSIDIINILKQKDRRSAGVTANPEGLYLKDVYY
ncbi:MAG: tRNA pseudouridine(38-40) synthase TruA [Bacilli bacterium]|nr:tRNA pseudouridine(38-40) synthase TruA [Bacilli bacterium]